MITILVFGVIGFVGCLIGSALGVLCAEVYLTLTKKTMNWLKDKVEEWIEEFILWTIQH